MTTTEQDRQAIAHLVKRRRDQLVRDTRRANGWDHPGIIAALDKVQGLDLSIVTIAAMRAAADPDLDTPGAIGNPAASCYRDRLALNSHVPAERFLECSEHIGQPRDRCSFCAAERIGADGPTRPRPRTNGSTMPADLRQLIRGGGDR